MDYELTPEQESLPITVRDFCEMESILYRQLAPAYLEKELQRGGIVTGADSEGTDLELWAQKPDGTTTTIGKARFALR